jgi:hypothetical protein
MPVTEAEDFDRELEGYTSVATDFGTKIEWKLGIKFDGIFVGFRQVPDKGELIDAAEYEDDGERYWSWLPFQLGNALRNIKPDSHVVIICTGDDDNAPHQKGRNKQLGFKVGVK